MNGLTARSSIQNLNRADDRGSGREGFYRFDKNERVVPIPHHILTEIVEELSGDDLMSYPNQQHFYNDLGDFYQVPLENLLVTGGSDVGMKYFFEVFTQPGDELVYLDPTYAMVSVYAEMHGLVSRRIPAFDRSSPDEATVGSMLMEALAAKPKALVLANPNQPTGKSLAETGLDEILRFCARNSIAVFLDEAYIEFSSRDSRLRAAVQHPSLFVSRTFSKAWGLAGVRLGFITASEENISHLRKVKPLADMNVLALKAGCSVLKHPELVETNIANVNSSKTIIREYCQKKGLLFTDSETNFVHVGFPESPGSVYDDLKKLGILTRKAVNELNLEKVETLRISLGGPKETGHLLTSLDGILDTTTRLSSDL